MISLAVRSPKATDRCTSPAVSSSSVPSDADRAAREANSPALRAERSSSCGSIPRRRTRELAAPLSTRIGTAARVVNVRW